MMIRQGLVTWEPHRPIQSDSRNVTNLIQKGFANGLIEKIPTYMSRLRIEQSWIMWTSLFLSDNYYVTFRNVYLMY